ncbi:MAG: prepilin-type N-terminal cleavage/methylation domain-containing protein [Candidatus Omnitrophota bacterium]
MKNFKKGFSLLEILIALTIFSLILITVHVTFNVGINSYKTIQINLNRYYEISNLLNRMTQDIKNSFPFEKNDCKFSGDKNALSFFTNFKKEYARIFYKSEDNKLLCSYVLGNKALLDNNNLDFEIVLSSIKQINFSYGYLDFKNNDIIWQDAWVNKENLPHSIKIDLVVNLEDRQEDLHFIKIINIPLGINEIK